MSREVFYRQCVLIRRFRLGQEEQTTWLPETYSVEGQVVKLKVQNVWDDGWVIATVGKERLPERSLPDYWKQWKLHRQATGDAEPKRKS